MAVWGLSLLLVVALATPALAEIKWKNNDHYKAYTDAYNEMDPVKKAALAEKFIADWKDADAEATQNIYWMMLISYYNAKNWAKAVETVDKQQALAPNLPADQKKQALLISMSGYGQLKNNDKVKEFAEKILAIDPNQLDTLITYSTLLAANFPTDETAKQAQLTKGLEITKRALAQPKPAAVPDAQWNPIRLQLFHGTCLIYLNQKKNAESMNECKEAIKINKKDSTAWYWISLALKPGVAEAAKKYKDSVDKLNENRSADQITRDDLTATMKALEKIYDDKNDEMIDALARAVAADGEASAQARTDLTKAWVGTPDDLNKRIADKKAEMGN